MADDDAKLPTAKVTIITGQATVIVEAAESLDDVRRAAREEHREACGATASREPTGFTTT